MLSWYNQSRGWWIVAPATSQVLLLYWLPIVSVSTLLSVQKHKFLLPLGYVHLVIQAVVNYGSNRQVTALQSVLAAKCHLLPLHHSLCRWWIDREMLGYVVFVEDGGSWQSDNSSCV